MGDGFWFDPGDLLLTVTDLAHAIRDAAGLVRLVVDLPDDSGSPAAQSSPLPVGHGQQSNGENPVPDGIVPSTIIDDRNDHPAAHPHRVDEPENHGTSGNTRPRPTPSQPPTGTTAHTSSIRQTDQLVLRFGTQTDTQAINGGPAGELTPERVAAYIAKYATKSADDFGVGDRRISLDALPLLGVSPHVTRIVETCWQLGEHQAYEGLRRWLHMLGFRGHFASKSRRYSTTLGALRAERRTYARTHAAAAEDAREIPDEDTTLVISHWQFTGLGYLTTGDTALALSAAARARERRQAARDAAGD